ncbi:hypothetical protein VC83_00238 [Pseudogymnoascus destructans]|uniref:Hydrophobin n=2 Tax=Pseudogymnoascus destructans TaxID=655981 RepID=L8FR57_PSED2|nr:uncharacterized protein VC83_00238 [Pseudogymnoascus destructans]ELR02958.1 hypothetical protein GMDG_05817 [Pseudogymnoascus destructans 20631-21]OAF63236.1 hypothetical protein VC83_00238 [Pseudogymnoascus destructans]
MQISKIITTIVATACVSTALPNDGGHGHEGGHGSDRPNNGNVQCVNGSNYCCQSQAGLLAIGCVLQNVLGACANQQVCCTNSGSGTQNCVNQNGLQINVVL